MLRRTTVLAQLTILLMSAAAGAQTPARPKGWSDATHGARVAPDYARLFSMDKVHEIRISVAPDTFRKMQADLKEITANGPFGPGGPGGAGPRGGGPGGPPPFGPGRGGPVTMSARDPMFAPVTVEHDGRTWTKVGMRFKGNSSLMFATAAGNGKLPFRLDFDRYEKESPEVRDQRFYGFGKLTFSSNAVDDSQLREVLGTEVFRDRGVPAPRAAFYRVSVDTGAGYQYWGLYAMVEDPSDGAMLQAQFGSRTGNLYKPDGPMWTEVTSEGFDKKNNTGRADFSDVKAAVTALNAPQTPAETWRAGLEKVVDVPLFLRWLAVNTTLNNWDVYGALPHNYYLYADPAQGGRLRWIPWDNNEVFSSGPGVGGPPGGGGRGMPFPPPGGPGGGPGGPGGFPGRGNPNDVLQAQVGPEWPLIQRLLSDPVYQARYRAELARALEGLMVPAALEKRARELHALIASSVTGRQGERATHTTISSPEAFDKSIDGPSGLIPFAQRRQQLIRQALMK